MGLATLTGGLSRSQNVSGLASQYDGSVWLQTSVVTIANNGAETTLLASGTGNLVIPANYCQVGTSFHVCGWGVIGTTLTPTLRLRFYVGAANAVIDTTAQTMTTALAGVVEYDFLMTCTATGASGSFTGVGNMWQSGATVPAGYSSNVGAVTVNTTVANTLNFTALWGTASASNTLSCNVLFIDVKG